MRCQLCRRDRPRKYMKARAATVISRRTGRTKVLVVSLCIWCAEVH